MANLLAVAEIRISEHHNVRNKYDLFGLIDLIHYIVLLPALIFFLIFFLLF